jgi:adenylosuccinate synthase
LEELFDYGKEGERDSLVCIKHQRGGIKMGSDPGTNKKEIEELKKRGIKPKLMISDRANIIMPYHKNIRWCRGRVTWREKKIGTTKKGIGPCYSDKIARNGIRAIDLLDEETLSKKLDVIIKIKTRLFI